jgi:hypothetical protein
VRDKTTKTYTTYFDFLDLPTGKKKFSFATPEYARGFGFSPDGKLLAAITHSADSKKLAIKIWEIEKAKGQSGK